MTDISIEADAFGKTLEELLEKVNHKVGDEAGPAVESALKKGEKAWRKNARDSFSGTYYVGGWGKPGRGRAVTAGAYARSIRHHMLRRGGNPEGEIGSAKLPGLAHLLEKGHAKVGGGFVSGRLHIAPAAKEAFSDFEDELDKAIEEALNDV